MRRTLILLFSIILIAVLAGCQYFTVQNPPALEEVKPQEKNIEVKKTDANSVTEQDEAKSVIVYFGDSDAMGLNGEERKLQKVTPETLVLELIKGPQDPSNSKTIPDGTKVLDSEINGNIVYINFSKELKDNHWGGSSGESITIYSIVNTLVLNPDLDADMVQILVEGNTIETLSGHFDISQPLEADLQMSKLR